MRKNTNTFGKMLCTVLSIVILIGIVFNVPFYTSPIASAQAESDKLCLSSDGSFRILQIADFQDYFCPKDGSLKEHNVGFREINTIRLAIGRVKPNLIVLTGDNIQNAKGTLQNGMTVFEYSVQKLTESFGDIPFVVTFGNHDEESNSHDKSGKDTLPLAEQTAIYKRHGALTLKNDITAGDTSENATATYGTGYLDIYDKAGNTVVQRVILINSGTYDGSRKPAQYGKTGLNATGYSDEYNDYEKVVSAVDRWTDDSSIKCIAFQHIPLQELYMGDSVKTKLFVNAENGHESPRTYEGSGIEGNFSLNKDNPTVSGEYNEFSGCSYSNTRELFNALANKENVVGLFFGHDHMNTVTGTVTVDGKSLVIGYGGSLLVDPSLYSSCKTYAHNPLIGAYTLSGNGKNIESTEKIKKLYTYYGLLRDYDIADFSNEDTYISDVRLFAADTAGMSDYPSSYAGYFKEAKANCIAAGYIPVEACYTLNTEGTASFANVADFNFGCYKYSDYYSGAKAVCLGYKITNNPAEAITDIRIYDGNSNPPEKWTKQEIWAYQNNSKNTGGNRSTQNNTDNSIAFYNANYDWNSNFTKATLRTDVNRQIRFCEGMENLGEKNNTWLYYTKDSQAGTPIKRIFVDITDTDSYSGKFDLNRFNTEYPYSFAQNLNGTYDFDRDNTAFNVRMGYTGDFTNGIYPAAKGSWAYIGLVHAVEADIEKTDSAPETPSDSDKCSHLCHSENPVLKLLWKIISFLSKLFGASKTCECGASHW